MTAIIKYGIRFAIPDNFPTIFTKSSSEKIAAESPPIPPPTSIRAYMAVLLENFSVSGVQNVGSKRLIVKEPIATTVSISPENSHFPVATDIR